MDTLLVVDGANVVGSVPDGWWREREAAAERLRDALAAEGGQSAVSGPVEIVLVVEGAARGLGSVPGVRVESAAGSGDDLVALLAAEAGAEGRACVVVTADRGLRARVTAAGAQCAGPRSVRRR
ncbi:MULTISPECIES: NTP pyrophosphohydrolase [unclassified Streptomyces]|uniref:NTP pyrophosphohydrolase n=1 Tax=unclassified Streptomyces TaxID=2593676 RepID=UPI0038170BA4